MIRLRVNSNGSQGRELIRERIETDRLLQQAIEAYRKLAPHGRDYQTCDPSAYELDRNDFQTRLLQLTSISEQLMNDALVIHDQTQGK